MATNALTIISRALRLCGVLDAGMAAPADDSQDALAVLNALLAEWYEAGIGFPDYNFASLTDPIATDAADSEALAYQLAMRVAPEYGRELSALIAASASESMSRFRLRYFQPGTVDFCELPSARSRFNIVTGDY